MPTLTTLGSLLTLLALARLGGASTPIHLEAPQILDETPFCDGAFTVLRRCASDLDVVESKCCGLVKAFQGQGCACPGCDDTSDVDEAEALNTKGSLWMLQLAPLLDFCTASEAEIGGEASLHSLSLEAPDIMLSLTEIMVEGEGSQTARASLEEISTQELSLPVVAPDAAMEMSNAFGEEMSNAFGQSLSSWEDTTEEEEWASMEDAYGFNFDDDYTDDYADDYSDDYGDDYSDEYDEFDFLAALEAEIEDEEEGWERADGMLSTLFGANPIQVADYAADTFGDAADITALLAEAAAEADAEELADDASEWEDWEEELEEGQMSTVITASAVTGAAQGELLRAEAVSSSEDFPLDLQLGGEEGGSAEAAAVAGGDFVVRRTRTVTLDLEVDPRSVKEAVQVLQQMLQSAAAVVGDSPLGALSRQVTIDVEMDSPVEPQESTLAASVLSWLSSLAPQASSAPQPTPLQAQLAVQLAAAPSRVLQQAAQQGEVCQCVGVAMPPFGEEGSSSTAYYHYVSARLALCQFTCEHRTAILVALVVEIAACTVWIAVALLRRATAAAPAAEDECEQVAPRGGKQFILCAADAEWRQPLLQNEV